MKFQVLILPALAAVLLMTGCNGDHSANAGKDTVKSAYGPSIDTAKVAGSNRDTAKVTTKTGSASDIDDGGSGGTAISKDTAKTREKVKK